MAEPGAAAGSVELAPPAILEAAAGLAHERAEAMAQVITHETGKPLESVTVYEDA